MIPDRCSFCKGKLREGKTEFMAHAAGEVIVIKDVTGICLRAVRGSILHCRDFPED